MLLSYLLSNKEKSIANYGLIDDMDMFNMEILAKLSYINKNTNSVHASKFLLSKLTKKQYYYITKKILQEVFMS